ncbi:hypothetical protein FTO74_02170 [Granulicella sp. WH15]|uniref:hypothetical protein n=1 Tax=Granulicella sp. WH15 TaxID=2602070 RepID=UPI001366EB75|nr:hypothetical protein [Granulicella sp. WH15]QHN02309.1 hypothetical protein FTO74_02170 [Granulicella sp. WH15]
MEWKFQLTAAARPRVLSRVMQLFDQQSLNVRSLVFTQTAEVIVIQALVEVEAALAQRLQAKLYRQIDLREVMLTACEERLSGIIEEKVMP